MPTMPYAELLHYLHIRDSKLRKGPELGAWLSRTGHVVDMVAVGGLQNPQLWVEGFFYAVPRLIMLKTKPFIQAEEAYRFFSSRCGSKKKGIVSQFSRALGLQKYDAIPTPGLNGTVRAIFETTIDFGLKAEWYFFIVDRVTEFAYNWTSLVYQWQGVKLQNEPHIIGYLPPNYHFEGEGNPLRGWGWTSSYILGGYFSSIYVPPGISATVSYSANSLPSPFSGNRVANCSFQLYEGISGYKGPLNVAKPVSDNLSTASDIYFYTGATLEQPQQWYVLFTNNSPDIIPYVSGSFQAYGALTGKKGLFFDP